jgi:biopolymer transport protein TolR
MPKLEQSSVSSGRAGSRRARGVRVSTSLAEINVVPLVDVMLVLLVIFMVAAPMMQQGYKVSLPKSRRSSPTTAPITVTVPMSFRRDSRVLLDKDPVPLSALAERIRLQVKDRADKAVMLAGDGGITLQEFMSVCDRLQEGGATSVAMQTQAAPRLER